MHKQSMYRMGWFVDNFCNNIGGPEKIRVLDVGSYDVNGSYKELFPADRFDYVGLDMVPGPNVDICIENPYVWNDIANDTFDVIISGQAFEHTEFFWVTLGEMARVMKQNGLLCIIAPNQIHEHRYPVDCYRFFSDGMISLARYIRFEVLHAHVNRAPTIQHLEWFTEMHADAMLIARKPYSDGVRFVDLGSYTCIPADLNIVSLPLVARPKSWKTALRMKMLGAIDKWLK